MSPGSRDRPDQSLPACQRTGMDWAPIPSRSRLVWSHFRKTDQMRGRPRPSGRGGCQVLPSPERLSLPRKTGQGKGAQLPQAQVSGAGLVAQTVCQVVRQEQILLLVRDCALRAEQGLATGHELNRAHVRPIGPKGRFQFGNRAIEFGVLAKDCEHDAGAQPNLWQQRMRELALFADLGGKRLARWRAHHRPSNPAARAVATTLRACWA